MKKSSFCFLTVPVQEPGTLEPEAMEPPVRAPEVTQEPQNLVTDEGEPVTFTCRIRGSPRKLNCNLEIIILLILYVSILLEIMPYYRI